MEEQSDTLEVQPPTCETYDAMQEDTTKIAEMLEYLDVTHGAGAGQRFLRKMMRKMVKVRSRNLGHNGEELPTEVIDARIAKAAERRATKQAKRLIHAGTK